MKQPMIPISSSGFGDTGQTASGEFAAAKSAEHFDYRTLFEQTGDCVFIISFDLKYIAVNPQAARLLGYSKEELVGKPVHEVMSLEASVGEEWLLGQSTGLFERILRRKDNTTFPVEISTSIVSDAQGSPIYIQSIARDISERKRAEQMLRHQYKILSVINDAAMRLLRSANIEQDIPKALAVLGDVTETFQCAIFKIEGNPNHPSDPAIAFQWTKTGYAAFDLQAVLAFLQFQLKDFRQEVFLDSPAVPERLTAAMPVSMAYVPVVDVDCTWAFLGLLDARSASSWLPSERDTIRTAVNIIAAALQRNSFEEKIRESELRHRQIIHALPDLIVRIDASARVLDYSARPDHPLYMPREQALGKSLVEIWGQEVTNQLELDESPKEAGALTGTSFNFPDKANVFEARVETISPSEKLVVIRDISDRARLDRMKSDFINRASHELRTPLTTAMLMCDLIKEGGPAEEIREYWKILTNELDRQKGLIDRLLMAGRLESGAMHLERVPLDLIPIVQDSWLAVKPSAQKKKIQGEFLLPDSPLIVIGDSSGLQQIFINLLYNAVKFSPEGSVVTLLATAETDTVAIAIADQGIGIPEEDLPNLFERFFRAKNVTLAEIPGSGVGLYIVKSIVEALDGNISVTSSPGVGTTFVVRLKLAK